MISTSGQGCAAFSAPPRWITDTPQLPWWRYLMISQQQLKEQLHYDPESGKFTRLVAASNNVRVGDVAGQKYDGYVRIQVLGVRRMAHCLAWFYMTGNYPTGEIDHRNGIRDDNRWGNLREGDHFINQQNIRRARSTSTTGKLGVSRKKNKFQSSIRVNGKKMHLGTFATADLAHQAYLSAKRKYHEGCTI